MMVPRPSQDLIGGTGSFSARVSIMQVGMGTEERITMKVSTLEVITTAFPAVMVMKNIPAAGKNAMNLVMLKGSTFV